MDVADLFHFQTAFHTDRIIDSSSDKEDVPGIGLLGGKPLQPFLILNDPLDLFRNLLKLSDICAALFFCNFSSYLRELNSKYIGCDQLGAVRLGSGNRDLRTRQSIEYFICLSGDR